MFNVSSKRTKIFVHVGLSKNKGHDEHTWHTSNPIKNGINVRMRSNSLHYYHGIVGDVCIRDWGNKIPYYLHIQLKDRLARENRCAHIACVDLNKPLAKGTRFWIFPHTQFIVALPSTKGTCSESAFQLPWTTAELESVSHYPHSNAEYFFENVLVYLPKTSLSDVRNSAHCLFISEKMIEIQLKQIHHWRNCSVMIFHSQHLMSTN